ncbi:MAG: PSD1 and planctomycete cytochrome C domain-containing protein [Planctomycetota bacterium]
MSPPMPPVSPPVDRRRSFPSFSRWVLLFLAAFSIPPLSAQAPLQISDAQRDFFETRIRPVLVEHCYECHSSDSRPLQGGLRLDSRAGLLQGGDSGPAVVPGKPASSLLLKALRHDGYAMPPKGRLADRIVSDFEGWIAMGLPDPRTTQAPTAPREIDLVAGRQHWAFRPLCDSQIPPTMATAWCLDPVDHFILAGLEARSLQPADDADRHTWLRRVSLDLTGLPPSPDDIQRFLADSSPTAYESVVDRLLSSRAFAERWARHWLDLTGYADQVGTSNDVFAEHAWRYRDYVIDSFHTDKAWDRFIIEQLAGDLLPLHSAAERAAAITATGFLLVGDVEIVNPDKLKLETDHIDFQLQRIGTAFMGMTLGCARCHDHKFDPIAQDDYYALAGTLRSTISTRKIDHGIWSGLNVVELPETPQQQTEREVHLIKHRKRMDDLQAEQQRLEQEQSQLSTAADEAEPEQPPAATARLEQIRIRLRQIPGEMTHATFFAPAVPRAFAVEDAAVPVDMPIAIRGNPYAEGRRIPRGVLRVAAWDAGPAMPATQSGRLEMAQWLANPRNPLTPRVTVNRIWQKLFGEGLVRSVDYFGTRGEHPSHPELLDHLATRLIRSGWSQKALIRGLVLSRTYRQSSQVQPSTEAAARTADPENRLLWKMPTRRLDAEAIRDSMLAVSGELQDCMGGPGLPLEFPENTGNLKPGSVNPPSFSLRRFRPEQEFQRTLYLPVVRSAQRGPAELRDLFDFTQPNGIAGRRTETIAATQTLYLLNNTLPRTRAAALAAKLTAEVPETPPRLELLWLRVFNRPLSADEQQDAESFLAAAGDSGEAWTELCHALLSSSEFLYRQ